MAVARAGVTAALGFAACALGVVAVAQLGAGLAGPTSARVSSWLRAGADALEAVMRLGREGREPGALERRRLLACGGLASFGVGALVAGPPGGLAASLAAPALVAHVLRLRRVAYRDAVERDAPGVAVAIADALVGGHSLRGALREAAAGLGGPGGAEMRRVAAELSAGARTEDALERLRDRCRSRAFDTIVAASLVQRRAGGDLAALLRSLAHAFEDERRVVEEARVATAQARLTGILVVALPAGGALLAELASPGFLTALARAPLTASLVGLALVLQVAAALLIRRIGRMRA